MKVRRTNKTKFLRAVSIRTGMKLHSFSRLSKLSGILEGVRNGYWKQVKNQRDFFDRFAQRVGIQTFEQWYHVAYRQFLNTAILKVVPCSGFMFFSNLELFVQRYDGSLAVALRSV